MKPIVHVCTNCNRSLIFLLHWSVTCDSNTWISYTCIVDLHVQATLKRVHANLCGVGPLHRNINHRTFGIGGIIKTMNNKWCVGYALECWTPCSVREKGVEAELDYLRTYIRTCLSTCTADFDCIFSFHTCICMYMYIDIDIDMLCMCRYHFRKR